MRPAGAWTPGLKNHTLPGYNIAEGAPGFMRPGDSLLTCWPDILQPLDAAFVSDASGPGSVRPQGATARRGFSAPAAAPRVGEEPLRRLIGGGAMRSREALHHIGRA